jgi:hypothetical protein
LTTLSLCYDKSNSSRLQSRRIWLQGRKKMKLNFGLVGLGLLLSLALAGVPISLAYIPPMGPPPIPPRKSIPRSLPGRVRPTPKPSPQISQRGGGRQAPIPRRETEPLEQITIIREEKVPSSLPGTQMESKKIQKPAKPD